MELRRQMWVLFGVNVLIYGLDLVILYKRFFEHTAAYISVFNMALLYAFLFSMLLIIPTLVSYFVLFNFLKNSENIGSYGDMVLTTLVCVVCLIITVFVKF